MAQRYKICLIRKLLTENTREVSVKRLSFTDCKDCQLLLMLVGRGRWRQVMRSGKNRGGKMLIGYHMIGRLRLERR